MQTLCNRHDDTAVPQPLISRRPPIWPTDPPTRCRKELAHIRCDHLTGARIGEDLHRGRAETEAESVAHIVCKALGLDSASYSDAYVMGWADGDMDLVKQCAETVLRVAKQILTDLTPSRADTDPDADTGPDTGPDTAPDTAAENGDPAAGAEPVAAIAVVAP
jgi:hypothetical protein